MTRPKKKAKRDLMGEVLTHDARRREAMKNGFVGLVPVCCGECRRPIATTSVDRARGEPAILFDFPEHATGWTCNECAGVAHAC